MASKGLQQGLQPLNHSPISLSKLVESMNDQLNMGFRQADTTEQGHAAIQAFKLTIATLKAILNEEGDQYFSFKMGTELEAVRIHQPNTPMINTISRQHRKHKTHYPNALLLYRTGDFFTLFHEDANLASNILRIPLILRDVGPLMTIPVCGFHIDEANDHLCTFLDEGYKVVIYERRLIEGTSYRESIWSDSQIYTPGT